MDGERRNQHFSVPRDPFDSDDNDDEVSTKQFRVGSTPNSSINHGKKQVIRYSREDLLKLNHYSSTLSISSLFDVTNLQSCIRDSVDKKEHYNHDAKNDHKSYGNDDKKEHYSHDAKNDHRRYGNDDKNKRSDDKNEIQNPEEKKVFKRTYPLGFKKLQETLNESPENVLLMLTENFDALLLLLQEQDISPDYISLILRAVLKIADSYFEHHKMKILHQFVEENFMKQLTVFVAQLPLHDESDKRRARYFWENPKQFFLDLNGFCETIMKMIPSRGITILPKLIKAAVCTIPILNLNEDIFKMYERLQTDLHAEIEKFHNKKVQKKVDNDIQPPDDFRTIPVYPKDIEITTNMTPFLRKNIIDGGYKDVEHYLDVQFRLVRNDFVKPLRDGILAYLDRDNSRRPQNIKVYNGITILKPVMCKNASNGFLIQLPKPKRKFELKLENSKLFMFGSLVCFTKDDFRTIIFGRIVDRDIKLLKESQLIVSLNNDMETIDLNQQYIMVESKVYFEPYYHALKALKEMDEDDLPMKQYIVDMELDDGLPEYYLNNTLNIAGNYRIPITNGVIHENNWPTMDDLKLNEAQYRAYKNALSRKFSVIQGPPGTGKTHLGLEVAKSLLHNHTIWHEDLHPLLVICYTNHALDQFLEGLLTTTEKIVRIGGQSKNENLNKYNLKLRRNRYYHHIIQCCYSALQISASSLSRLYNILDAIREFKGIVNVLPLLDRLPEIWDVEYGIWDELTPKEFKKWLLGGNVQKNHDKLYIDDLIAMQNPMQKDEFADKEQDDGDEEMLQQLMAQDDYNRNIDDDIFYFDLTEAPVYIVTLTGYKTKLEELKRIAVRLKELGESVDPKEWFKLENEYQQVQFESEYLEKTLEEVKNAPYHEQISPDLIHQLQNPDYIDPADRWKLYIHWMKMYEKQVLKQIKHAEVIHQEANEEYEDAKMMVDIELLRENLVIGMTTTGAARLQSVLKALRSRIVIVEEAAEIMEAHVITSLTKHCEHLILIGDHQQLRPSTADFLMETKYNLGISLFERMIRNKVECNVLEIQHRMRPEFATLIVPTIYPVLHNHESVYTFPRIKGVHKNLFFIHHEHPENEGRDDSKLNMHEVEYLIRLAQYLILNGYKPEDITILCAYSAQLFKMFAERKKFPLLCDIRICVLDNYQGEESKIILLSLVRNNKENKVGFLKIDNRVCVALSRAREGFYIMGNIEMLSQASQEIWGKIRKTLEEQESLGDALPLYCEIHRDKTTYIKSINDFQKVVEGGCDEICNVLLQCEHLCKVQCHIGNRDHAESRCREKCTKLLCDDEHPCPKMCFEECGLCMVPVQRLLPCGHTGKFSCSDQELLCTVPVDVTLSCEHATQKPCYLPIENVVCPHPCDVRVESCGHICVYKCHVNEDPDHLEYKCRSSCDRPLPNCSNNHRCIKLCFQQCNECETIVKKHRSCGHVYFMKCGVSVESKECLKPCKKKLPCGHDCKQECSRPCGNCAVQVEKEVIECGHKIKVACKDTPTKDQCNGKCPLLLRCGHQCQARCKEPCKCNVLTKSVSPLLCGHFAHIPCSLNTHDEITSNSSLLSYCKEPCETILKCKHICEGNCGECYQGRIHKVCSSDCGVPLLCGHICKTPCRDECPPCNQKCFVRCPHSKCRNKCGEVCTPCKKRCTRTCIHQACDNACQEICSVDPCKRPCPLLLKCKHPCIGFCGDPCPPLCRICDEDEVAEIFCENEDEEDARFVLLEDCRHVVESEEMNQIMEGKKKYEITIKGCPECKTPVINTRRYGDYVKEMLKNVMDVKKKYYGSLGENVRLGKAEIKKLDVMCRKASIITVCPLVKDLQKIFESKLKPIKQGRCQVLTKRTVNSTIAKIQILENICDLFQKNFKDANIFKDKSKTQSIDKCLNYINYLLNRLKTGPECMTRQEVEDFKLELKRLCRIFQLESVLMWSPTFRLYAKLNAEIYSVGRYDVKTDASSVFVQLRRFVQKPCYDADDSLQQITSVIGVKLGAWYKCQDGHIFAIGECDDANQHGECPDCSTYGRYNQLTLQNSATNIEHKREDEFRDKYQEMFPSYYVDNSLIDI